MTASAALPEAAVNAEMRLLLACLRWPLTEQTRLCVARDGAGDLDWDLFIGLVGRHRVHPLVAHALRDAGVVPPPAVHDALRSAAAKAGWAELRLAGELKVLLTAFQAVGIKPVVLKGLGLAIRAYGRLGMRYNRDIDLLIERDDLPVACGILESAGFGRIEPAADIDEAGLQRWLQRQKDVVFFCPARQQVVELHWRLFDNPHLMPIKDNGLRAQIGLAPNFDIDTLPSPLDLIFVCVHGAHHAWSRLKWIADLNAILAKMTEAEVITLHEKARGLGMHRATAQAMLLCARLLGLAIPAPVLADARRDWRIRALDRLARHSIFASGKTEIEERILGSTLKNISHYLLANNLSYMLSEAYYDLTDLSADNASNLPGFLVPFSRLYFWISRQASAVHRRVAIRKH